jgi:hypothetical protein
VIEAEIETLLECVFSPNPYCLSSDSSRGTDGVAVRHPALRHGDKPTKLY